MKLLRLFLALWLSLAMPATALAAVLNADHCSRMPVPTPASSNEHAGHDMQSMSRAEHVQHMQQAGATTADTDAPSNGCKCGCDCASHHCVAGASGVLAGSMPGGAFAFGAGEQLAYVGPSRKASAHHLDLLRPPSLI